MKFLNSDRLRYDPLMPETSQSSGNNSLLEEYMGKSVPIIGQRKQFHEGILVEAHLDLEHIFL